MKTLLSTLAAAVLLAGCATLEAAISPPPQAQTSQALARPTKLKSKLRFMLRQIYDSNIYLESSESGAGGAGTRGVRGSWITSTQLGLNLDVFLARRHHLEAGYDFTANHYTEAPKDNHFLTQAVGGSWAYKPWRGSTLRLKDSFLTTADPASQELSDREKRWQNTVGVELDVEKSRGLLYGLDGQQTINKYLNPTLASFLNRTEFLFGGRAGVRVQPKTRLYFSYHQGLIRYTAGRNSNSISHFGDISLDGAISPRLNGRIMGGFFYREYAPGSAGLPEILRTWTSNISLSYKIDRFTDTNLGLTRMVNEAAFGANSISTSLEAGVKRRLRRLTLGLAGGLQIDHYSQPGFIGSLRGNRRDDIYRGTVSADYEIKQWLSSGVSFSRNQRFSTFSGQFNYVADWMSLDLRGTF
jgi:hypothetical protein